MKLKRISKTTAVLLAIIAILSVVAAQTFYFVFNQTPYYPSNYEWTAPWEVKQKVDFAEATLIITGCGYQNEPHDVELTIKNVATEPNYAIISVNYEAVWNGETIIFGTSTEPLEVGESTIILGEFTPVSYGSKDVTVTLSDIQWVETESITWQTKSSVELPNKVSINSFSVSGASKTYVEAGNSQFQLEWIDATSGYGFCSWKLEVVELGLLIGQEKDVRLDKHLPKDFNVSFDPLTQGGLLTMKLTIDYIHN